MIGTRQTARYARGPRSALRAARVCAATALCFLPQPSRAQELFVQRGEPVSPQVERMYLKGAAHLVATQTAAGEWAAERGAQNGPGITGLATVALLAHGDDPNEGPYAGVIHRAVRQIMSSQDANTGYIGPTMYHHGFATLALAESYGAVQEPGLGPALQRAVNLILSSQKGNPRGAWRYSPDARDADTTVSGAQMVALLAARNAGIDVPQEAIGKGCDFYRSCQDDSGGMGYTSPGGPNVVRTAIGLLAFVLADQRDTPAFRKAADFLRGGKARGFMEDGGYAFYTEYYSSQAAFHTDEATWAAWNAANVRRMALSQQPDGSWNGPHGPAFSTSCALLSLALNYRFLPIYER